MEDIHDETVVVRHPTPLQMTGKPHIPVRHFVRESITRAGTLTCRLFSRLNAIHNWTSMFTMAIGILVIVFGFIFSFLFRNGWSLGIALSGVLIGSFFIGMSKIVEAAEAYLSRHK